MRRLAAAIRANPYILTAVLSGTVAILAVAGILTVTAAALAQGALSILLGVALAVTTVTTRKAIQRRLERRQQ